MKKLVRTAPAFESVSRTRTVVDKNSARTGTWCQVPVRLYEVRVSPFDVSPVTFLDIFYYDAQSSNPPHLFNTLDTLATPAILYEPVNMNGIRISSFFFLIVLATTSINLAASLRPDKRPLLINNKNHRGAFKKSANRRGMELRKTKLFANTNWMNCKIDWNT